MNSTSPAGEPAISAILGVSVGEDGTVNTLCQGTFDAGQADEIARQLVILASSIRSTARQRLFEAG